MRKAGSIVATVAITLMAWGFASQALADTTADITELEHKCAAATTVDEAMQCFTPSEDITIYDLSTPSEFVGQKAVRADFEGAFANFKNPKVDFVSLHVVPSAKLAVAYSIQHMTATDSAGKPLDFTFRVTDVWRKEKGGWKIVHAHISFPTDMATGKAAMQSK
jgi:ketosteroid isomerase-like protein